jgi:hypothetical protein
MENTEKDMAEELTKSERKQIAEILDRRANEIAGLQSLKSRLLHKKTPPLPSSASTRSTSCIL